MVWTNDAILELAGHYKEYRCLWDVADDSYTDLAFKDECWNQIAEKMNRSCEEIRRKIVCLLASFRRERLKIRRRSTVFETYKSNWFAYNSLAFLNERYKKREIPLEPDETVEEEVVLPDPTPEVSEKFKPPTTILLRPATQSEIKSININQQVKRKRPGSNKVDDNYIVINDNHVNVNGSLVKCRDPVVKSKSTNEIQRNLSDSSSVFGDYLAMKHRKYSAFTKSHVEHLISNILYEADIGHYDDPRSANSASGEQYIILDHSENVQEQ